MLPDGRLRARRRRGGVRGHGRRLPPRRRLRGRCLRRGRVLRGAGLLRDRRLLLHHERPRVRRRRHDVRRGSMRHRRGACCLDGDCEVLSPEDCADAGGVFRGIGRPCGIGDCDISACCLPDECLDMARYACDDLDGVFVEDQSCAEDACLSVLLCPADTLFGQLPDSPHPSSPVRASELRASPATRTSLPSADRVAGSPGGVSIWTTSEATSSPSARSWTRRSRSASTRTPAACRGISSARTRCSPPARPRASSTSARELNEYEAILPEPCVVTKGWISIVGLGDPECWFLWMSAGLGELVVQPLPSVPAGLRSRRMPSGRAGGRVRSVLRRRDRPVPRRRRDHVVSWPDATVRARHRVRSTWIRRAA